MDFKRAREAFSAGNVHRVCAELTALYPNDSEVNRLREFVAFAIAGGSTPKSLDASTRALLASMAGASPRSRASRYPPRHFLSRDLDFIADLDGVIGWGLTQALNRLALDNVQPSRRCAVIGTVRDDGIYILEWVAHYLALGFEHLFIYTNDNADSSLALLVLLAEHGIITLLESEVTGAVPPEAKAFGHALNLLPEVREYEWGLFVDSDEFLVLAPRYQNSIHRVLDAVDTTHGNERVAGICYDWLWFISDMVFERRSGLLCERFQHARPHWLSKCLIRIRDVQSMRRQHYPEVSPGFLVTDSEFKPLDIATIWERREAQYGGGRLNHYWPKSFQEYAVKKARGASLGGEDNLYDRPYKQFFTWNGYSTSKNLYPTDNGMLFGIKNKIAKLCDLEGVATSADRINREFPQFVRNIVSDSNLRNLYKRNAAEPDDL